MHSDKDTMSNHRVITIATATVLLLLACSHHAGAETDYRGQLSTWATITDDDAELQLGGRYISELSLDTDLSDTWQLSGQIALDAYGYGLFDELSDVEGDGTVDPYRLWIRFASPQFEARAGLQKISFGSAALLRPLMWFDSKDPRDPLQLTDGVYGLLARYTFLNNANIRLWGLYGNDDLRGWEVIPTASDDIEWGGRIQVPAGPGELALSYHHRRADPADTVFAVAYPGQGAFAEDRIGLDGKWDAGIGLWFEFTMTRQEIDPPLPRYRRQLTVGSDYTFSVGNGLTVLGEHFVIEVADGPCDSGETYSISAVSCNYPLGIFDSLTGFVYYDWEENTWSPFIEWRRTYDQWQIHVGAFGMIGDTQPADATAAESGLAGTGVRVMLVFSH
jgi:hypothetical protein